MIVWLPLRWLTLPCVKAIGVTWATPGTARSAAGIPVGMPVLPVVAEFWTIRLPAKEASIAWLIEAFVPAARIEIRLTSARPIISAAAVTAVRPGWRIVLSRARRAVMPRQASGLASRCARPTTAAERALPMRRREAGTRSARTIATTITIVAIPAPLLASNARRTSR